MKKIMISLLAILVTGIMSGCQKGESAKLTVYFVEDEANFYYSYIAKYTAEHSDVEIDMKKYSDIDEMESQLVAAISGGRVRMWCCLMKGRRWMRERWCRTASSWI